jgi:hypothetical protein
MALAEKVTTYWGGTIVDTHSHARRVLSRIARIGSVHRSFDDLLAHIPVGPMAVDANGEVVPRTNARSLHHRLSRFRAITRTFTEDNVREDEIAIALPESRAGGSART